MADEFKRRTGRTIYRSADAFVQRRLDQYIANIASGGSSIRPSGYGSGTYGGGIGGGAVVSSISSWLICRPAATALGSNAPNISDVVFTNGSAFDITNLNAGRIDFNETGLYHIDVHLCVAYAPGVSNKKMTVSLVPTALAVVDNVDFNSGTDTSNRNVLATSFGFVATASNWITIVFSGVSALDGTYYDDSVVTIIKLAS